MNIVKIFLVLIFMCGVFFFPGLLSLFSKPIPPKISSQQLCCRALQEITGNPVLTNFRPDFLKNPSTKRNLELDCYDPILKIGIEYDGIQHYVYPNNFHRSKEEFEKQKHRDKLKEKMCQNNSVKLIRIPYTVDKNLRGFQKYYKLKEFIYTKMSESF